MGVSKKRFSFPFGIQRCTANLIGSKKQARKRNKKTGLRSIAIAKVI
jgi:hypothetical protein